MRVTKARDNPGKPVPLFDLAEAENGMTTLIVAGHGVGGKPGLFDL